MEARPRGGAEANGAAHHVRSRGAPLCSTPRPGPGTAIVMNDRSPWPRSSRGLSTLCPPRLFGIGDRRHGQSVDNPASRSAIDPAGDQFQCRRGVFVSQRSSFRWRSTRTEHRPFHWAPPGRADAGAACRAPTKTEHRPIQKRAGPRRTSPFHAAAVGPAHGPRRSCGQGRGAPAGRDGKGRCSAVGRRRSRRVRTGIEMGDVPSLGSIVPATVVTQYC